MYLGCAAWIDGFQRRFEFHLICELHGLSCRLMNIVNEMNGGKPFEGKNLYRLVAHLHAHY